MIIESQTEYRLPLTEVDGQRARTDVPELRL